ncbi:MAG: hypothetical protein QM820_64635 [Minicystis sp.]
MLYLDEVSSPVTPASAPTGDDRRFTGAVLARRFTAVLFFACSGMVGAAGAAPAASSHLYLVSFGYRIPAVSDIHGLRISDIRGIECTPTDSVAQDQGIRGGSSSASSSAAHRLRRWRAHGGRVVVEMTSTMDREEDRMVMSLFGLALPSDRRRELFGE